MKSFTYNDMEFSVEKAQDREQVLGHIQGTRAAVLGERPGAGSLQAVAAGAALAIVFFLMFKGIFGI